MSIPKHVPGLFGENPHDRLIAAIAILQAHYLAGDSVLNGEAVFGNYYFKDTGIEHAINILIELLPIAEAAADQNAEGTA